MSKIPRGSTVWSQLFVRRIEGVAEFYEAVLGWRFESDGGGGVFTLRGEAVAGVTVDASLGDDRIGWRPFLGGGDLDAAVGRAVLAGAEVRDAEVPLPVPGRAVELTDPFGAWFGLADLAPESAVIQGDYALGRMAMTDPSCHDLEREIEFQERLFPGDCLERLDHGINIFRDAQGLALRGAYELPPVLAPHWLNWFVVADQGEAARISERLGGSVNTVDNELSFGGYAVVVDPAGAQFKALQLHSDRI